MKVLYLGYWPSGDGLTQSVIVPRLRILSEINKIEEIFFCSIERNKEALLNLALPKVRQLFFQSKQKQNVLLTKLSDFNGLQALLAELLNHEDISLIICNSPLAGIEGYRLHKKNNIPFVVECFEPHALYMHESGAWKRWDPRFLILSYYESKQKKHAWRLATVSEKYTTKLITEGVSQERIFTVPNCISLDEFKFDEAKRSAKRLELSISSHSIVGIYVGKFGDIYYDEEAFDLFAEAFDFFGGDFWLIILSSASKQSVTEKLQKRNVMTDHLHVVQVAHEKVPDFLSASDFAFSTIRPSPARSYCCPVKDGEYWANGLPILLEDGIGDDSDIIKKEGGGIIINSGSRRATFQQLLSWMKKGRATLAEEIFPIAVKHRRMEYLVNYYKRLFDQQGV